MSGDCFYPSLLYANVKKYQVITPMRKTKTPELVTLAQAVDILKVHPNTLRKWDKKGILKAVRFGQRGDRRYYMKDIENFMTSSSK